MMRLVFLSMLFISILGAKVLIKPEAAMQLTFGNVKVERKNKMLTRTMAQQVQQSAKAKLKSKIVRIYHATQNGKKLGYGILLNNKVRTKNAAVLYLFDPKGALQAIEIVAFNEPLNYVPSKAWLETLESTPDNTARHLGKGVPVISGATLSAKTLTEGARTAQAIFEVLFKAK